MKNCLVLTAFAACVTLTALADTTWISTSDSTWTTTGNWNNGLPSTGPQLAIYADSGTVQHTINLNGATARNTIGLQFNSFAGGSGFTFNNPDGISPGFQSRAGGAANGILNNDGNAQTFNVAIKLFSSTGVGGATAGQVFNAASGDIIFSGNNPSNVVNSSYTVDNNGGTLTNTGAFNITIGSAGATKGNIVGAGGLYKSGAGTLTLGGNVANTYSGGTTLAQGKIVAAKNGAFGSGNMALNGGTLELGSFVQSLGTLSLGNNALIDFGSGTASLSFANSSLLDWTTFTLSIANWTSGVDTLRFGTDSTGLTSAQLSQIVFADLDNATAQIDSNGFVSAAPVPEPSVIALGLLGGAGLLFVSRRRS